MSQPQMTPPPQLNNNNLNNNSQPDSFSKPGGDVGNQQELGNSRASYADFSSGFKDE
jgi:hypothetical protein